MGVCTVVNGGGVRVDERERERERESVVRVNGGLGSCFEIE
jgi:hypothetical protein